MKKVILRAALLALCIAMMALSLSACGGSGADSGDIIKLKMAVADAASSAQAAGARAIAEEVEKATNGRVQIEVMAGGTLGGERDTVELAMLGGIDIVTCANSVLTQWIPEMAILDQPYLFTNEAQAHAAVDGPVGELIEREALELLNLHVVGYMDDLVPTLDAATKTIMFPAKSLVLNWPEAPADSQFGTDKDAWYTGKNAGYLVLPGGEYKDPWVEVGEGTISGDFYFNCFGKTPTDYKVKVYQSTSNKNIYRVDDALKGLYASQGWQGVSPTFEFDVTDPANISLPLTSTGINGGTDGMYYAATSNQAYESISDCPEAYRATFKSTTTETGEDIVMDFPAKSFLLVAMTSQKIYYANTSAATLKVQKTSGVADIAIDDENVPVEYYNLQGVRVNEPAAGTLVIRRQGAKVSKVLVK